MEHPFFPTTTTRAEALRWLTIAEKLLSARDLMGSKSFATRARDSDRTLLPADQILAVADTLIASDKRINNNQHDLYSILQLAPHQAGDLDHVATQYRRLALLLNPQKNKFPFADQAFRLVVDAWSVLSNPSRKALYDKEMAYHLQQQPDPFNQFPGHESLPMQSPPSQPQPQNFIFFGAGGSDAGAGASQAPQVQVHVQAPPEPVVPGFSRDQLDKQPQHGFINFSSGNNIAFSSPSGSASGPGLNTEEVNKQPQQQDYPGFGGNVDLASGSKSTQERLNKQPEVRGNKQPLPEQNLPNVANRSNRQNASVREQVENGEENVQAMENASPNSGESTFWTACPYCYHMFEYLSVYADCTLRCQKCKRAFQGVVIPSPPPAVDGQEGYFCCWGLLPLGVSMANLEKGKAGASSWTPFTPMFTCPQMGSASNVNKRSAQKSRAPRVYVDDDDIFVEISEPSDESDDDWQDDREKRKKKMKNVKGKGTSGTPNKSAKKPQADKVKNVKSQEGGLSEQSAEVPNKTTGESSKKGAGTNARKQPGRVAKNFGRLDLNVEFSNEGEEPAPGVNQDNGPERGEDENIEGISFFEGLDEFLSSLPILNVVGDDKVVKAA